MEGFRVRVNLSRYFVDERAKVLLWIPNDPNCKAPSTIAHLERRLRKGFGLGDSKSFCLCLAPDGFLLPSNEPLTILKPDDSLTVVPIAKNFNFEHEECESPETPSEIVPEKEIKKKKRKKQKEMTENLLIDEIIEKINSKDTSNKENSPTSPPDSIQKKKKTTSHSDNFVSAIENIKKIHAEISKPASDDEIENLKLKALTMIKDLPQPNGISDGRITKRKRVRIRKSKKNNSTMMTTLSDVETSTPHRNNNVVLLNGKVNSHIRFSLPENLPVTVLRNKSQNIDDKPRIVQAIQPVSSDSEAAINDKEVTTFEKPKLEINNDNLKLDSILSMVDNFPIATQLPKNDDVILFKMLKMDEQYTPVISNYILGKINSICSESSLIQFEILDGQTECSAPNGKFDIEDEETSNLNDDSLDINWNQLIEPRIVRS